jgi:hypothetical protein
LTASCRSDLLLRLGDPGAPCRTSGRSSTPQHRHGFFAIAIGLVMMYPCWRRYEELNKVAAWQHGVSTLN